MNCKIVKNIIKVGEKGTCALIPKLLNDLFI